MPHNQKNDPGSDLQSSAQQGLEKSLSSKVSNWLRKHYLLLINGLLAIYVFLPILAPVLMKVGLPQLANPIYKTYRLFCHQLAYRSFFLFGEQSHYPLELAGIEGVRSYEEVTGNSGEDQRAAIAFIGNEELGYKIAFCERDLAIYASLLLFGLLFSLTKKKWKPLPWLLWILLALGPIGLDGISQLISRMDIQALSWLGMRESTPFLRVLSGSLFGWFTAWFGLPSIEEIANPAPKEIRLADEGEKR